jgi:hypothetical protein
MGQKTLWSNRPAERLDTRTREVLIELTDSARLVVGLRVDVTLDASRDGKPTDQDALRTLPAVKQSE